MPRNGILPLAALSRETIWLDANRYNEAERRYHESGTSENARSRNPASKNTNLNVHTSVHVQKISEASLNATPSSSLASEIAQARQKIQNFLKSGDYELEGNKNLFFRVQALETEKDRMNQRLTEMSNVLENILKKLDVLGLNADVKSKVDKNQCILENQNKPTVNGPADDDDDIDLFGSDEETEEDIRIKQERVKAYENKKAKKPALVAKSSVVLDVKPWSDETDMKELEIAVRKIQLNGLNWGASKLVPLAYGIKKLQIIAIVEDDKVSIDELQESIEELEDLVQSVDIAAFNKL